jgi:hypothetical protein
MLAHLPCDSSEVVGSDSQPHESYAKKRPTDGTGSAKPFAQSSSAKRDTLMAACQARWQCDLCRIFSRPYSMVPEIRTRGTPASKRARGGLVDRLFPDSVQSVDVDNGIVGQRDPCPAEAALHLDVDRHVLEDGVGQVKADLASTRTRP